MGWIGSETARTTSTFKHYATTLDSFSNNSSKVGTWIQFIGLEDTINKVPALTAIGLRELDNFQLV